MGNITIDKAKIEQIESSNNQDAVSKKGAVGVRQITQPALTDFNKANKTSHSLDMLKKDINLNRKVGDWYMDVRGPELLKARGKKDTEENRLISYNAGARRVGGKLPKETTDYIAKYKGKATKALAKRSGFGSAFAAARKQGVKTFSWNGKKYTTEVK